MANGILCQACGIEAPTKYVEFHQNIGMLITRRRAWCKGNLCKRCLNKKFWSMTGTTLVFGPWGVISVVIAPVMILNNVARYAGALGLQAVPAEAKVPVITEADAIKLNPYTKSIIERLNAKEPMTNVARDIAPKAGVTPGQVVKYVVLISKPKLPQPPSFGFHVRPIGSPRSQLSTPIHRTIPSEVSTAVKTDGFGMVDIERPARETVNNQKSVGLS